MTERDERFMTTENSGSCIDKLETFYCLYFQSVDDRDIAAIVEMGFTVDKATTALRQNNNNVSQAVEALLRDKPSEPSGPRDTYKR